MEARNIALLGAGKVGKTLAAGFAKHGHHVVLGSREPDGADVHAWVDEVGESACSASYADAIDGAEWIFLCLPAEVVEETVRALGQGALAGKIVVDVSNSMGLGKLGQFTVSTGLDTSPAQEVQVFEPTARVVKAFNSTGVESMIDPQVQCAPPTMPICGDDAGAKAEIGELLREVGWEPADLGGIEMTPILIAMTVGWAAYRMTAGIRTHCYKFVTP